MRKAALLIIFLLFVFIIPLVLAHGEDQFDEAKELIDSKASCNDLSDEQLEMIGDYLMEQMHPGEQHKNMDDALGGEGSENLMQTHIRMARMMYCGEMSSMMNMPMMGAGMMQQNNFSASLTESRFFWLVMGFIVALLIFMIIKFLKKPKIKSAK